MNPSFCCMLLVICMLLLIRKRRIQRISAVRHMIKNRKGQNIMLEMLERFVGKECVVYGIENQITGTIREIRDGWIIMENSKGTEAVNAEYVTRVREYPRNKKGKKAVLID